MAGVSVEYQPTLDLMDQYNERIGNSNLLLVAYTRNTRRLLTRWKAALKVEPAGAPNYYPIKWQTAKQRRAFFATNGFGGGIPHQRTHALSQGWQGSVDSAEIGGTLRVYNDSLTAGYVYGDFDNPRQRMFDASFGGIPWGDPFEISAPYFDEAEVILISTWHTILDPTAGI